MTTMTCTIDIADQGRTAGGDGDSSAAPALAAVSIDANIIK
jgi:hypothetical protein